MNKTAGHAAALLLALGLLLPGTAVRAVGNGEENLPADSLPTELSWHTEETGRDVLHWGGTGPEAALMEAAPPPDAVTVKQEGTYVNFMERFTLREDMASLPGWIEDWCTPQSDKAYFVRDKWFDRSKVQNMNDRQPPVLNQPVQILLDSNENNSGQTSIVVPIWTHSVPLTRPYSGELSDDAFDVEVKKLSAEIMHSYDFHQGIRDSSFAFGTVYRAYLLDHPQVFWLSNELEQVYRVDTRAQKKQVTYGNGKKETTVTVTVTAWNAVTLLNGQDQQVRASNYRDEKKILADMERITADGDYVKPYLKRASGVRSNLEKVMIFNEMLSKNNVYNDEAAKTGDQEKHPEAWQGLTALKHRYEAHDSANGGPVCESYAEAMKILCDLAEIPCVLVTGQVVPDGQTQPVGHMWNYVCLNDGTEPDQNWYAVDVTWNKTDQDRTLKGPYFMAGANTAEQGGYSFINSHPPQNKLWDSGEALNLDNGPELTADSFLKVHPLVPGDGKTGWQADITHHWKAYTGYLPVAEGPHDHLGASGSCSVCGKVFAPIELSVSGQNITVGFYDKDGSLGIVAGYEGDRMVSVRIVETMGQPQQLTMTMAGTKFKAFLLNDNKAPVQEAVSASAA